MAVPEERHALDERVARAHHAVDPRRAPGRCRRRSGRAACRRATVGADERALRRVEQRVDGVVERLADPRGAVGRASGRSRRARTGGRPWPATSTSVEPLNAPAGRDVQAVPPRLDGLRPWPACAPCAASSWSHSSATPPRRGSHGCGCLLARAANERLERGSGRTLARHAEVAGAVADVVPDDPGELRHGLAQLAERADPGALVAALGGRAGLGDPERLLARASGWCCRPARRDRPGAVQVRPCALPKL